MAMYKGEDKIKDIYLGDVPIFKVYAGEEFCGFFTFSHENLISNSDLLIDSNSDNIPDGFTKQGTITVNSLVDGIWSVATTGGWVGIKYSISNLPIGSYIFARYKASSSFVRLSGASTDYISHSGNNQFEFVSKITTQNAVDMYILDTRSASSDSLTWEVDYMGAINITDLVSRGILPSGLTNSQYKDILDNYFNS